MGFSLSASAAVIGVAVFISVEFIVADFIPTLEESHDCYDEMRLRSIEKVQSSVNITSVLNTSTGPPFNLSVSVRNTGSITFDTNYCNILVNGSSVNFESSKSYIYPEDTIYFNLTDQSNKGRIKFVTEFGISDYYKYQIT